MSIEETEYSEPTPAQLESYARAAVTENGTAPERKWPDEVAR